MKTITNVTLIILLILGNSFLGHCQNITENVENPLGLRIKKNGIDYLIYSDKNLNPNPDNYRKINYQVYFRKVNYPVKEINKKKYQLITIPGAGSKKDQNNRVSAEQDPRNGKSIDKEDYDLNFWIEEDVIKEFADTEYYKYANDVFSGLLTAPFKYRLKTGSAPEAIFDGDFNVAPFLGWKFRVSTSMPYFVAPFVFTGITTLNYNSANNTGITNSDDLENGTGITYGGGISFKFGDISPGFILGYDKGLGNLGDTFLYSNKPWISFSISYDFFKPKQTSEVQL
jgi:hypothetical protein